MWKQSRCSFDCVYDWWLRFEDVRNVITGSFLDTSNQASRRAGRMQCHTRLTRTCGLRNEVSTVNIVFFHKRAQMTSSCVVRYFDPDQKVHQGFQRPAGERLMHRLAEISILELCIWLFSYIAPTNTHFQLLIKEFLPKVVDKILKDYTWVNFSFMYDFLRVAPERSIHHVTNL